MLVKFPAYESFTIKIGFSFCICCKYYFSVLLWKNYYKHWKRFLYPLIFNNLQVMWQPVPLNVLSLSHFFIMFQVVFTLLLDLCYKPTAVLLLSFFYTFSLNFTIFDIMHFCFWMIVICNEGIQASFTFASQFYSLCNRVIFIPHLFICLLYIYLFMNLRIWVLEILAPHRYLVDIHVCM